MRKKKNCKICLVEFTPISNNQKYCDKCRKQANNLKRIAYYQNNRQKYAIFEERYRQQNRQKIRDYHRQNRQKIRETTLKRRYDITIASYNKMFQEQNGRCGICGRHQSGLKRNLCVDHNHESGRIRGLLCHRCNTAIGMLEDDTKILQKATKYLGKP